MWKYYSETKEITYGYSANVERNEYKIQFDTETVLLVITLRSMVRWVGYVARTGMINSFKIFIRIPKTKRPRGRHGVNVCRSITLK
jgi:hypothetical protein